MAPDNCTGLVEVFAVLLASKSRDLGNRSSIPIVPRRPAMKSIERRVRQHFKDDDLSPDVVHELATIVEAVVVERLAERARRGGRARAAKLSARRRREIAKLANAAKRTS
jgi:hypothetical protein